MIKIAPSILAADFARLGSEAEEVCAAGADWLHFDVMDGEFVHNITIGLPVLKSLRRHTDMFTDVHMMVTKPRRYAGRFCELGADMVTVHVEADEPVETIKCLQEIHSYGRKAGLALKGIGVASQHVILRAAAGHGAPHRANDQVIDDRKGDQEIHHLNQEGDVDIDHSGNLQPKL